MTRQLVHTGKIIKVYVETTTAPDGSIIRRDIVQHPGAVAILPLVDDEHVCLLRQRRANVGGMLLEIPAGTLEPDEAPELAAVRELAEETGYRAGKWRKLCEFYPSPGVLSEITRLFVASELTPGQMQPEKDEDLAPEVVSWNQALEWALDGTIRDAKTLMAVLFWERLRQQR
jgi:ADP-ribose pyrophosphatase